MGIVFFTPQKTSWSFSNRKRGLSIQELRQRAVFQLPQELQLLSLARPLYFKEEMVENEM